MNIKERALQLNQALQFQGIIIETDALMVAIETYEKIKIVGTDFSVNDAVVIKKRISVYNQAEKQEEQLKEE